MKVKIVNHSKHALPEYQTPLSAGLDIRANLDESVTLRPLERAMIPTGLFVELPEGCEMQIRPRSGLAAKHGITVLNSPGTIDADYRGEIKVILVNLSNEPFTIESGERIAQMIVARYEQIEWLPVEELGATERGAGGFGSTGR
ncbi:MAG: dUTP diphosphatase [Alistipes sp.]|nr:dUTP diphosphatase [Alistipes sp.]MBR3911649.1 dUTP diphosphatase [Alistipes sp.]